MFRQHRLLKQVTGRLCPRAIVCRVQKSKGAPSGPGEAVTVIIQWENGGGSDEMSRDGGELVIEFCSQWDLLLICQ